MPSHKHNSAFSLIELSVVITIISIIIAAVITGDKLIEQSKLNKLISEVSKYKAAISTFRTEYQALPGDFATATDFFGTYNAETNPNGAINGDGDGYIDSGTYSFREEPLKIWHHLELAELTQANFERDLIDTNSGTITPGEDIPKIEAMDGVGLVYVSGDYFMVGKTRSDDNPVISSLTPFSAWSIDRKIDDGLQNGGDVQGVSSRKTSSGALANYCDDAVDASLYDLDEDDIVCNLQFKNIIGYGAS